MIKNQINKILHFADFGWGGRSKDSKNVKKDRFLCWKKREIIFSKTNDLLIEKMALVYPHLPLHYYTY